MLSKRMIAAGFAMAAAITVITVPSASAGTVQNGYSCQAGLYGWQEALSVTVNVPATARQGDTITVTGSVTGTIPRAGARAAGTYHGSIDLQTAGASSWVTIAGMASPAARDGDPYALAGGSGQLTLNAVGVVTFMPQHVTWALAQNYGWSCFDPDGVAPVAASVQVLPR
jgi:hypothetical protein